MKVVIQKSNLATKKFKAIFDGKKTVHFGATGYRDRTLIHDKQEALKARANYRKRHVHDRLNDYMSPGALSWYILWGNSQNMQENIRAYKRKFNLN